MQNMDYIIPKISRYIRIVTEGTNKRLSPLGIYNGQWALIIALKEVGSATQSELVQYLSIEAPTLTRMLNRLEELGFVYRTADLDRRVKVVSLTEEAKAKFHLWDNEIVEYRKQLFKGFSNSDIVQLHQIFDKLIKNSQVE